MKKNQQQDLFKEKAQGRKTHGGAKTKGKRKGARPLARTKWIHLILKSQKAKGPLSFHHKISHLLIEKLIQYYAKKFGIRIGDLVIMTNHIHLKIKIHNRDLFQSFLRVVPAMITRQITNTKKGQPGPGRFWDGIPFTRILTSSFEELQLRGYFKANRIEATQSYQDREDFLDSFNDWLSRLKTAGLSTG